LSSKPEKKGWDKTDPSILHYGEGIYKKIEFPIYANVISRIAIYKLLPSKIMFPDSSFLFHFLGIKKLKEIRKNNPDIIYSRSTPFSSTILAYKIKKKLKIPWVMHLSDPWAGNPYRDNQLINKDRIWEKKAFNMADLITLTSENAVAYYHLRYPELSSKILYFPNVFDPQNNYENDLQNLDKLKIIYSGNLYGERNLEPFLLALDFIERNNPELLNSIKFIIAGNIDEFNLSLINKNNRSNWPVTILGPLSNDEALKLIRKGHLLLTIDKPFNTKIDNLFFPSKIMDYIAANRFILGISNSGSPTFQAVHKKYGICFQHDQIKEIGEFLISMIMEFKNENFSIFRNENEDHFFSAKYQANKLKSVFEQL